MKLHIKLIILNLNLIISNDMKKIHKNIRSLLKRMIILTITTILDNSNKNTIIIMVVKKKAVKVLIITNIQIKRQKMNNQIMKNNIFK